MKNVLKWIGIGFGIVFGLLVLAVIVVYLLSNARFNRSYDIEVESVEVPTDQEAIEYGEHIASIFSCMACHGDDLSGRIEFEDLMVGRISNANLTTGAGGIGVIYQNEDWIRAVRHGVGKDGKPLKIMPAKTLYRMSDEDLGPLIAYLKTIPPVDNEPPELTLSVMPRVMFLAGPMDFLLPAEQIDHDGPRPSAPERGVTAEYGEYLSGLCTLCHGESFSGGSIPGAPPGDPPALNLTPAGSLKNWTIDDFIRAMRTGERPSGSPLRDEYMPWSVFAHMTDAELEAIWLYLQALPAKEYGNR